MKITDIKPQEIKTMQNQGGHFTQTNRRRKQQIYETVYFHNEELYSKLKMAMVANGTNISQVIKALTPSLIKTLDTLAEQGKKIDEFNLEVNQKG